MPEARDAVTFIDGLMASLLRCGVLLHAYVLMENQFQLLVSPDNSEGVSQLMRLFSLHALSDDNRRKDGSLQHSLQARLVFDDKQLLDCYRAIEHSPVRNCLVAQPGDYYWSSYACNAAGLADDLITPHPAYLALNRDDSARRSLYRALFTDAASKAVAADTSLALSGLNIWSTRRNRTEALAAAGWWGYSVVPDILERS